LEGRIARARHAAGRRPRTRKAVGGPLAALAVAVLLASIAPNAEAHPAHSTPSPSPSRTELPSSVSLSETPDGTGHPQNAFLLKADLSPAQAFGLVTLADNGTQIASGVDYEVRWTYSAPGMSVGVHHLTVVFTPDAATGYGPSRASIDYVVEAVSPSPSPTPTQSSPTPSHTPTKRPSATVSASASHTAIPATTGPVNSAGPPGEKASLPFTGLNAEQLLLDSAVLIGSGVALLLLARVRRRDAKAPGQHTA